MTDGPSDHTVDAADVQATRERLTRLDHGRSWVDATLRLLERYPGMSIAALARRSSTDVSTCKADVRRLVELGVAERSGTGARLTALGEALLRS